MSRRAMRHLAIPIIASLVFAVSAIVAPSPAQAGGLIRTLVDGGLTSLRAASIGSDAIQSPELFGGAAPRAEAAPAGPAKPAGANRSQSRGHADQGNGRQLQIPQVRGATIATTNAGQTLSINGLNHRDQRLANNGNQFSLEPPDQGLCVGNGLVMETVNDVLRVYTTAGQPVSGVADLNTFYGYPAQFDRTADVVGPQITDPSCYFDPDTHRWFHVVLTLDVDAKGDLNLVNHLDIAVSQSADPTGSWHIYKIPVTDDGTSGTPKHTDCPCVGDYPHIGADANGFFITTNEYPWLTNGFNGAQLYAMSKKGLTTGRNSTFVTFENLKVAGNAGFTVWPAISPASKYASEQRGTEYFLSSMAAPEAGNTTGIDNRIAVWALTNTRSLSGGTPDLDLKSQTLQVGTYAIPPASEQKAGTTPLRDCLNDRSNRFGKGLGCWFLFFDQAPGAREVESHLDSNDSRMQQVTYVNGVLWGALDTAVMVNGEQKAGIAWYAVKPSFSGSGNLRGEVSNQGYLAVADNNVIYPAIALTASGRGVMAFTLVGKDYYPSAAYASIDVSGTGLVHVARAGMGPQDGFSGYTAFSDPPGSPARPRWGDYGAAVADGNTIWMASEYIGQTCTLKQYLAGAIGSCGGTRTSLANWATRITAVVPSGEGTGQH